MNQVEISKNNKNSMLRGWWRCPGLYSKLAVYYTASDFLHS